jgi:hypothetical protein
MNEDLTKTDLYKKLSDFVKEIRNEYEIWYAKSVRRIYLVWYVLQITTTITVFIFAIVSSIAVVNKDFKFMGNELTVIMVLLPALSSALSNILIKFRVYDLWMIREQGRMAFQNLYQEGQLKLSSANSTDELKEAYSYLVKRTNEIEEDQQTRFFSVSKTELKPVNPGAAPTPVP